MDLLVNVDIARRICSALIAAGLQRPSKKERSPYKGHEPLLITAVLAYIMKHTVQHNHIGGH